MSTTPSTLTPEDAYNVLVAEVHAPVFFEKLARVYGIKPQTQEEARELLLIAGQLRNAHEQENTKQAGARANYFSNARRDLSNTLAQTGYTPLVNDDHTVKQAADAAVTQSPLIKEAALVFSQFMAQRLEG